MISGPTKYNNIGTNNPQASRPPEKLSAASSGPMIYPTPI